MLDVLITSVNAVVPIILLILLGYLLKRFKFLNDNFIKIGNKFVFKVCLPCMLFINIYDKMNSFADIRWDVVLYSVLAICAIFGLGLLTAILTTKKRNRRGVILQCSFRSNFAIIGLTLVERLGGDLGLAGIISAFSIPVFNILAVVALSVFAEEKPAPADKTDGNLTAENAPTATAPENETTADPFASEPVAAMTAGAQSSAGVKAAKSKHSVKNILLNIVKNPLIIGVVLGLVCVGIREIERACGGVRIVEVDGQEVETLAFSLKEHLKFLYTGVSDLKAIASPLALIVLGGQFKFSAVKGMTKEIIVGTAWRIVLAPLIGIGVAYLLSTFTDLINFGPEVYPTLIALFGTPVAVSSAIMAGEMGGDEQLATQLVVWTSLCSIITIFATVFLIGLITV